MFRCVASCALHPVPGQLAPQPGKLPRVGCQHRGAGSAGEPFRVLRQGVQGVGVQHQGHLRRGALQHRLHQRRCPLSPAKPRADGADVAFPQPFQSPLRRPGRKAAPVSRQGEGHGLVLLDCRYLIYSRGHAQIYQPRPRAHRRPGAEGGRAGVAHGAAQQQNLAVRALVAQAAAPRQGKPGIIQGGDTRAASVQNLPRDADIRNAQRAAADTAGLDKMSRLGHGKRHRDRGPDRRAQDASRVGLHAAGNVRRDDGDAGGVHGLDGGEGRPAHRLVQADAEQRVDDNGGGGERHGGVVSLHTAAKSGKAALHLQKIRRGMGAVSRQKHPYGSAGLFQLHRRADAVSAVVSAAAEHQRRAAGGEILPRCLSHGAGGPLHQDNGGDMIFRNGALVRRAHLRRAGQKHGSALRIFFPDFIQTLL